MLNPNRSETVLKPLWNRSETAPKLPVELATTYWIAQWNSRWNALVSGFGLKKITSVSPIFTYFDYWDIAFHCRLDVSQKQLVYSCFFPLLQSFLQFNVFPRSPGNRLKARRQSHENWFQYYFNVDWSGHQQFSLIYQQQIIMNGFSTGSGEEDSRDSKASHDQLCCLIDDNERCSRVAGNASYSKRIQKTVQQRKLRLHMDSSVRLVSWQSIDRNRWNNFLFTRSGSPYIHLRLPQRSHTIGARASEETKRLRGRFQRNGPRHVESPGKGSGRPWSWPLSAADQHPAPLQTALQVNYSPGIE